MKNLLFFFTLLMGLSFGSTAQVFSPSSYDFFEIMWPGLEPNFERFETGAQLGPQFFVVSYDSIIRDANGRVLNSYGSSPVNPNNKTKTTGTVNGNDYEAVVEVWDQNSSAFVNNIRESFYSDGTNDTAIHRENYDMSTSQFRKSGKAVFSYNSNGDVSKIDNYNWDASNSVYVYSSLNELYYSGTVLDSVKTFDDVSGNLQPSDYLIYYWSGTTLDSIDEYEYDLMGVRTIDNRLQITYNSSNNISEVTYTDYDSTSSSWVPQLTFRFSEGGSSGVGLTELFNSSLKLYPNPAQNTLSIEGISEARYEIVSLSSGQSIASGLIQDGSVNILDLSPGLYVIRVHTEKGALKTARFLKH